MKYYLKFLIIISLCFPYCAYCLKQKEISFEFRPSYFNFSDKIIRKIYSNTWMYQAEIDAYINRHVGFAISGQYYQQNGTAIDSIRKTKIELPATTFLLKIATSPNTLRFYFGVGPRLYFLRIKNYSEYVQKNVKKTDIGITFAGGIQIKIYKHLIIDPFFDYSFKTMHFLPNNICSKRYSLKLDGLMLGIGIGGKF